MDERIPGTFLGDCTRLRQVLANLVSNAVKFTRDGGVKVRLRVMDERDSVSGTDLDLAQYARARYACGRYVRVRCEVHDTGIGISEEQQRRLFNAFSQVPSRMVAV